ncbi:MAG: S41 family peptidase [Bacteroidota bacterium]
MKKILFLLTFSTCLACEKEDIANVSNQQVFEEMWQYIDENYIYFEQKGVDWEAIRTDFTPQINEDLLPSVFREICFEMLNTLRDGHNRLTTPDFDENYPYEIGYDIHFDLSVIQKNYLNNDFQEMGFYTYGFVQNDLAYVHFSNFKRVLDIRAVMDFFHNQDIKGMIFDVRDNPGGDGQDAVEIVGHFIEEPTVVGYLVEKIGKAQDHVSKPLFLEAIPRSPFINVPLVLLTNRRSYSASTYLTSELKDLPNVTLVGQITGGGGGGNQTQELSNGWLLTVSSSKLLDVNFDESLEEGVIPDIVVENDSLTLVNGVDEMLERAIEVFK